MNPIDLHITSIAASNRIAILNETRETYNQVRNDFAQSALPAVITSTPISGHTMDEYTKLVARASFKIADEMMKLADYRDC